MMAPTVFQAYTRAVLAVASLSIACQHSHRERQGSADEDRPPANITATAKKHQCAGGPTGGDERVPSRRRPPTEKHPNGPPA